MPQPTIEGLQLNAGTGGSKLATDTWDTDKLVQVILPAYSSGDGTGNVVMLDAGLPVQPQTGATFPISAATLPLPAGAATQATLASVLAQLDITLSALRDALRGTGSKTLTDVVNASGGGLTDAQLRASAVAVSWAAQTVTVGNFPATQAVTQSGTWTVGISGSVAVTGALTDTQLRAAPVPVSLASTTITGTVAVTQSGTWTVSVSGSVAVTGSLTDAELRAADVKVSLDGESVVVTGPLTDTQLRATAVPVALASTTITGSVAVTGTFYQATQPVSLASVPSHAVTNAGTFATQSQIVGDDGTTKATVFDLMMGNPLAVMLTDVFGQPSGSLSASIINAVDLPLYVRITNGSAPVDTLPVSLASVPSHAVTNAGTFAVQAAQSGTWNVGTVTTLTGITNPVAVTGTFYQATQPVSLASVPSHAVTNAGTFAVQVDGSALTALQLIDDPIATIGTTPLMRVAIFDGANSQITSFGGGTQYTEGDTDATITGTALMWEDAANTLVAASAAKPLPISDAGGSLTVDGTVAVSGSVAVTGTFWQATQPVSGTFWQATQPVSLASVPSHEVTNAGTFPVQAAQSGTWNVGTVTTVTTCSTVTNLSQLGGQAIAMGTGVRSAGTLRVTVATDDVVPASQSGTWTVGLSAAQTLATVTTVGTVTTITNVVHVDDNSGSLTVDNNGTFAVQAACTNAGTFAVQAACVLGAETTKVIGTVNVAAAQTIAVTNAGTFAVQAVCTNAGTFAVQATLAAETTKVIGTVNVAAGQTIAVTCATAGNLNCTEANSAAIKTAVETIDNAISGSEMQVDVVAALPAGTNAIGKLAANSGVDIGDVDVTSIAAGANLIGDVGLQPRTSGGLSFSKLLSAASTNLTQIKATAGQLYGIFATNINAAVRYLKIYNAASASVTVGTTVPDLTLPIPASAAGAGFFLKWPQGVAFGTGISIALTTGIADNDTGAVAANELTVHCFYK